MSDQTSAGSPHVHYRPKGSPRLAHCTNGTPFRSVMFTTTNDPNSRKITCERCLAMLNRRSA